MKRYQLRLSLFMVFLTSMILGGCAALLAFQAQAWALLGVCLGAMGALATGLTSLMVLLRRMEGFDSREREDLLWRLEALADESFRAKETLEQVRRECEAAIGGPISMQKREKLARILLLIEENQSETVSDGDNSTSFAA